MNIYQHIIDEGEITIETINKVVKIMGNYVNSLDVKSSNGSSFVFITPSDVNVYQYFKYDDTASRIIKILNSILKKNIKINYANNIITYNLHDFICKFVSYEPNNIIIWKKHVCLNSFDKLTIKNIIINNLSKLLWDIGRSLYALHQNNIYHGDARIDNIGILNGNFILFDFDGSRMSPIDSEKDVYDFTRSIKFNVGNVVWNDIKCFIPTNSYNSSNFIKNIINIHKTDIHFQSDIVKKLDNLKILYKN